MIKKSPCYKCDKRHPADKWQDTLSLETTAIDCVICDVLDSVIMIIDDMETVEEGGNNEMETKNSVT